MEQQHQSAKDLIAEYQHLFALNLNELGKTSLVQHDITLNDMTPFKEWCIEGYLHISMRKLRNISMRCSR